MYLRGGLIQGEGLFKGRAYLRGTYSRDGLIELFDIAKAPFLQSSKRSLN